MDQHKDHSKWEAENSLTSPADRPPLNEDRTNMWRPDQGSPPLTNKEVDSAMLELNNQSFTQKFPRIDRTYADPPPPMQNIGLISFVPSKGATPDKDGIFGFAKLRGNYQTPMEANQRAEFIIRNADSYNTIQHAYVGRPFPITIDPKYSAETEEIDIRKATTLAISLDIKDKKKKEQREVDDMKEREQNLLDSSKDTDDDPYELYITLKVKKAQLIWTYQEHKKKMAEVQQCIIKARKDIAVLDTDFPTYQHSYLEKYMKARTKAGIEEKVKDAQDNFIKFLVEDIQLDFDEPNNAIEEIVEQNVTPELKDTQMDASNQIPK
jgi:hypothetical protein